MTSHLSIIFIGALALAGCLGAPLCKLTSAIPDIMAAVYDLDKATEQRRAANPRASFGSRFHSSVSKICPGLIQTVTRSSTHRSSKFLGKGTFGHVLKVGLQDDEQAVKLIKFKELFVMQIAELLPLEENGAQVCLEALFGVLDNPQLFRGKGGSGSSASQLADLKPAQLKLFNRPECQAYPDSVKGAQLLTQEHFHGLRAEVQLNKFYFSGDSKGVSSNVG